MNLRRTTFYQWLLAAAIIAAMAALPIRTFAQAISGDLVGSVTDASGAAIPNATVTATNTGTSIKYTATTSGRGEYRISNLPPGTYTLSASASGFAKSELANVPVQLNQTATANLTLQLGQVATTVNVVEASTVLDTTTAQIQNTFSAKQAEDLPNVSIGAGVLNMSLLSAGVATSGGLGVGTGPSIGGQRPRNNNFMIEGIDNNSKSVTGPQVVVPNDAVQEFTLLQNQFQAEYGHSSGGQFSLIVKSGTNQFHGVLYEYMRNRDLNALDQTFKNQGILSNPRYDQNRLGANFGGPIIQNKWFFFMNFEYNPLGQASTVGAPAYGPTDAGFSMLSGIPHVSATNLQVLKQYATAPAASTGPNVPTLTVGGQNIPMGILNTVGPNFSNSYFGVFSSDYNISERDQLRGRLVYNRVDQINAASVTLPYFYTPVPTRNYLATLAWYHTFTPTLTNEFRLGYNRQNQDFPIGNYKFPGLDQFPNLVFNNQSLQIGPDANFPQYNINNMYQGTENVIWTRGNHTFKFGTEFRKYIAPSVFVQRSRGDYEYNDMATYLMDQTPDYIAERGLGNSTYYGDQIASYSYAQDTWRIRPNLTLDLGVRYEYTTIPYSERLQNVNSIADVPGLITFGTPTTQTHNFVPRLGVAYSPGDSGNTVFRAGFGMAYDVLFDNLGLLSLPPQFSTTVDQVNEPTPAGGYLGTGGILPNATVGALSAADARAGTAAFIPGQKLPYSINWNFNIQHVFAKDYTFQIGYVGTRGVHLPAQIQLNRQSVVTPSRYLPTYFTMPSAATLGALPLTLGDLRNISSISPAYAAAGFQSTITSYQPEGSSTYNGLTLQLNRRFSNGLQMIGAYTWSHNIDDGTAEVYSTELSPRRAQDFNNLAAERASSLLDRRQRFTLSVIYDVPFFKNSGNWLMKNLVGNWEVAPIYTYESPEWFTVQNGIDSNLNHDSAGDRPIINPSGAEHTGTDVTAVNASGNPVDLNDPATVAYVAVNPNARYVRAGYGALANAGRNTEPTRPIDNIDLTLLKRFSITERMNIQFGAQALNLFNHAQFIPGSIDDVGIVSDTGLATYTNPQMSTFNNPEAIFSSSPRVIQLFAKLSW